MTLFTVTKCCCFSRQIVHNLCRMRGNDCSLPACIAPCIVKPLLCAAALLSIGSSYLQVTTVSLAWSEAVCATSAFVALVVLGITFPHAFPSVLLTGPCCAMDSPAARYSYSFLIVNMQNGVLSSTPNQLLLLRGNAYFLHTCSMHIILLP